MTMTLRVPAQPVQAVRRLCTPAKAYFHERYRPTVMRLHRYGTILGMCVVCGLTMCSLAHADTANPADTQPSHKGDIGTQYQQASPARTLPVWMLKPQDGHIQQRPGYDASHLIQAMNARTGTAGSGHGPARLDHAARGGVVSDSKGSLPRASTAGPYRAGGCERLQRFTTTCDTALQYSGYTAPIYGTAVSPPGTILPPWQEKQLHPGDHLSRYQVWAPLGAAEYAGTSDELLPADSQSWVVSDDQQQELYIWRPDDEDRRTAGPQHTYQAEEAAPPGSVAAFAGQYVAPGSGATSFSSLGTTGRYIDGWVSEGYQSMGFSGYRGSSSFLYGNVVDHGNEYSSISYFQNNGLIGTGTIYHSPGGYSTYTIIDSEGNVSVGVIDR